MFEKKKYVLYNRIIVKGEQIMCVLTVAVPSYNAQSFLWQNIPTFLYDGAQGSVEVIIVDDGSTDDTAGIADDLKNRYPGIVNVVHKENGGHGSAVNSGIENAQGKYFMICDADDYVNTDSFRRLVDYLKKHEVDIVLTDARRITPDGRYAGHESVSGIDKNRIMKLDDCVDRSKNIEMHNCCIRTELLRTNNVSCHEHLFYVDNEYVVYSLAYADTIVYLDMTVYQYLVGRNGQSVSIESRRRNHEQYMKVVNYLIGFYEDVSWNLSEPKKRFIARKIAYFITGVYSVMMSYRDAPHRKALEQFDGWLREKSIDIYNGNNNICVAMLRRTNMGMYGMASIIYKLVNRL